MAATPCAAWGDIAAGCRRQLSYRYFWMQKLAVYPSYAQDTVARFGAAAQAALTTCKGP